MVVTGSRSMALEAPIVRDGVAVFLAPGGVPVWFDHESVNQVIGALSNATLG